MDETNLLMRVKLNLAALIVKRVSMSVCWLAGWQGWLAGQNANVNTRGAVGPTRKLTILASCWPDRAGWLAGLAGWPEC